MKSFSLVVDLVVAGTLYHVVCYLVFCYNLVKMHSVFPCLLLIRDGRRAVRQVSTVVKLCRKSMAMFSEDRKWF